MEKLIIAIDGPAASGKSTTAKLVARRLGYLHIDTGAMYRAMALKVLRNSIPSTDSAGIAALAASTSVRLEHTQNAVHVVLDGERVDDAIRSVDVTNIVSNVSAIPEVRGLMVQEQRAMGSDGGIVLEGRDIGTVVFPNAEVKIFLVADVRERALRRQKELATIGTSVSFDEVEREIRMRDSIDSSRQMSPLTKAKDAVVLDTTHLSIEEQAEYIVKKAEEKIRDRHR